MLLVLAVSLLAAAAYLAQSAATYPARRRQLALRRAAGHHRRRGAAGAERAGFRERVLAPAVRNLAALALRLTPRASVESISARLLAAGLAPRVSAPQFLAVKGALAIGGVLLASAAGAAIAPAAGLLLAPLLGVFGFLLPESVLTLVTRSRRERIRSELPDALDLLAVSMEAGLGFDAALTKLAEHMQGPLVDELVLMLGEIRMGESRHEALRRLAGRLALPEVAAFARAVTQADQLGISLGRILRVQAADSRLRRQAAAEERAMKAPIKMLFPTVLFIFPAMFVVILGPALLNLARYLG